MGNSIGILAVLALLAGCTSIQHQRVADSEGILAEAGFQAQPLTGPDLKMIHPRQLIAASDIGTYEFADPQFCRCRYIGGAKELSELQGLRSVRQQEHERMLKAWSPWSSADPRVWGPWKPVGVDVK